VSDFEQKTFQDDPFLQRVWQLPQDRTQLAEGDRLWVSALDQTWDIDLRFRFIDYLKNLGTDVENVRTHLDAEPEDKRTAAAVLWAANYDDRKKEFADEIASAKGSKPFVIAGAGLVLTAIVSGLLGEVAKTAWEIIVKSAK
jgi:hypothetical protein